MYQKNTYFIYHETLYLHPIVKPELITIRGKNGNNHNRVDVITLQHMLYHNIVKHPDLATQCEPLILY